MAAEYAGHPARKALSIMIGRAESKFRDRSSEHLAAVLGATL
jgi:hypothetical protein